MAHLVQTHRHARPYCHRHKRRHTADPGKKPRAELAPTGRAAPSTYVCMRRCRRLLVVARRCVLAPGGSTHTCSMAQLSAKKFLQGNTRLRARP